MGRTLRRVNSLRSARTTARCVLVKRLGETLQRINPLIPAEATQEAIRRILHPETASLIENNRRFHQMLVEGVPVEYRRDDGSIAGDLVKLIDFDNLENNDWAAINQFTVIENKTNRRPDILVFINGLPLGVIELKNIGDENATVRGAFNQINTYKSDIPTLFAYNELAVISDGINAKAGTLTADWERYHALADSGRQGYSPQRLTAAGRAHQGHI
jgi:type I restriction enzyme, R subunit